MSEAQGPVLEGEPAQDPEPQCQSLADLMENPALLKPPEAIIPGLAYKGRTTILAGREKLGKSTFVGQAVAALSTGEPFLGEPMLEGRVLYLGPDEAIGDTVRRLAEQGANPKGVFLSMPGSTELKHEIWSMCNVSNPFLKFDLVVIDSLTEFARIEMGRVPADGANEEWNEVVRPIVALSRELDVAILLIHHARKSDDRARGATEIFAAVDATYEMLRVKDEPEDSPRRRLIGSGRWEIETKDLTFMLGEYHLKDRAPNHRDLIYQIAKRNPGCSKNAIFAVVGGRRHDVLDEVNRMVAEDILNDEDGITIN